MFLLFCLKQLEIIMNGIISCSLLGTFYDKIFKKKYNHKLGLCLNNTFV